MRKARAASISPSEHGDPWRLLIHAADDGAWNMAVDEAILDRYAADDAPPGPTLRLYSWDPPTLSLGARQEASHDATYLREQGIALVRRPTGGRAVLHEHERTFAVIGSLRRDPFPGGVLDTYGKIAAALVTALRALGIEASESAPAKGPSGHAAPIACFDRTSAHEITIAGRKVVGSAQVRRRGAFLQHGSILLRASAERLGRAVGAPVERDRFTDLEGGAGRTIGEKEIDAALAGGFEAELGARLTPGDLTVEERERATRLRCWKYDSAAWTLEGRLGSREIAWGPLRS
jgi:lipoate-protein ligase A